MVIGADAYGAQELRDTLAAENFYWIILKVLAQRVWILQILRALREGAAR